jgi:hypothetical protein
MDFQFACGHEVIRLARHRSQWAKLPPVTSVLTRIDVVVERSLICAPQFCADTKSLYIAGSHHAPNCSFADAELRRPFLWAKIFHFSIGPNTATWTSMISVVIVRKPLAGSTAGSALFLGLRQPTTVRSTREKNVRSCVFLGETRPAGLNLAARHSSVTILLQLLQVVLAWSNRRA